MVRVLFRRLSVDCMVSLANTISGLVTFYKTVYKFDIFSQCADPVLLTSKAIFDKLCHSTINFLENKIQIQLNPLPT